MKKFLIVILLIVALGLTGIRFGSALFQEENTFEILVSIVKLEFTKNDYIEITESSKGLRNISKDKNGSQHKIIQQYMRNRGWDYKEQMGAGYFFEKAGKTVVIETRLFTKNYFLWDVPKEAIQ